MADLFKYKLPVSGTELSWRPLTLAEELQTSASFATPGAKHLEAPALYAKRIQTFGARPGVFTLEQIQLWDSLDYESFAEEVTMREAQRKAALLRQQQGNASIDQLEQLTKELGALATQMSVVLGRVLEEAKSAQALPLESST